MKTSETFILQWIYIFLAVCICSIPVFSQPDTNLRILKENPRYFQYKGIPTTLFWGTHHWGWNTFPTEKELDYTASYANYITIQATNFRYGRNSTYLKYWERINDDGYWEQIRQSVKWALERDILVYLYHYDGYGLGKYHYMDWLITNPDGEVFDKDLAEYGLPGITPRDIHKKVIEQTVKFLWDCPNVVYDMCFEIMGAIRHGRVDVSLTKWWNNELRKQGKSHNPEIEHLITTMYGAGCREDYRICEIMHPHKFGCDFIMGQSGSEGFLEDPDVLPIEAVNFNVPLVRMALQYIFHENDSMHFNIDNYHTHPNYLLMRKQITKGIHSAEPYGGKIWKNVSSELARNWYLQLRFYTDNIETWRNEPGDEITEEKLPHPVLSKRPSAANISGFTNGHKITGNGITFGFVYSHPEGIEPSRAEVWVDLNSDGRFDPDYNMGERIRLIGDGTNFKNGVTYTSKEITLLKSAIPRDVYYFFRVGDKNWLPAESGGVIPVNNSGMSYQPWKANY